MPTNVIAVLVICSSKDMGDTGWSASVLELCLLFDLV
jgi:hypothetical protein